MTEYRDLIILLAIVLTLIAAGMATAHHIENHCDKDN